MQLTHCDKIPALDPAFDLLLQCLQVQSNAGVTRHIPSDSVDWDRFLDLARKHAVRPLAHQALAYSNWTCVPSHIRSSLTQFTQRNGLRNLALTVELIDILNLLDRRGIQAATFKGPLVAECLYGSLALREFLDIDIVVRQSDFKHAEQVLRESGFETLSQTVHQQDYFEQSGQGSYRRPGERFSVDLHWKLAPLRMSFPFPEDEIWSHLQKLPLAGSEVPSLAWDHLALFMAFHGAKERWRSLKWICDFSELVRGRPELDWGSLLKRSAQAHCSASLLVAASLSRALGLAFPPQLLAGAESDPKIETITRQTLTAIRRQTPETDLSIFFYTFRMTERAWDKLMLALTLLTTLTVSDFRAIRLPARLRTLYYLIRPFRIAGKAVALLVRRNG